MTRTTTIALCLSLVLPTVAAAAPRREPNRDRSESRQDQRALHDDLRDAQQAEWLQHEFERARAVHDNPALRNVDRWVLEALDREVREATEETEQAARELEQDERRVHHERRDLEDDAHRGLPPRPDDRHDLARARGARQDDRHDLMREEEYRRRVIEVRNEWARFPRSWTGRILDRKHALLEELVRLSHFEIANDTDELREDRHEHREDRH
jgi:hypothetical protein